MSALQKTLEDAVIFDLAVENLRSLNAALQGLEAKTNRTEWSVLNPRGAHAIAVGVTGRRLFLARAGNI